MYVSALGEVQHRIRQEALTRRLTITPLLQAGIGCAVLDTATACRRYNMLMADGRHVVAALMMVS